MMKTSPNTNTQPKIISTHSKANSRAKTFNRLLQTKSLKHLSSYFEQKKDNNGHMNEGTMTHSDQTH